MGIHKLFMFVNIVAACAATIANPSFADSSEIQGAGPTDHIIEIVGAAFVPATLIVKVGDSVTWVNRDIVPHTATARDGDWDTDILMPGEQHKIDFQQTGTLNYICRLHPAMAASLKVEMD